MNNIDKTAFELQAEIQRRIANDEEGLIYTRGDTTPEDALNIWLKLEIKKEFRSNTPFWNLVTDGKHINHIHLMKRDNIEWKPSVIMGDNIESDEGMMIGTVSKYTS